MDRPDLNMQIAGLLADLAAVQASQQRKWAYKRAAAAIRDLDNPIEDYVQSDGSLQRIRRIGPASARVILEVLEMGTSPTVELAVANSDRTDDVTRSRALREHFLSRARTLEALADLMLSGPSLAEYQGDLQMHSTWSDGSQALEDIVETALSRGYAYSAVTDHSAGLPIAHGLDRARFEEQAAAIERINSSFAPRFRLLRGVEANIRADGEVDVDRAHRQEFDIVVAAPHSGLRLTTPQTERMLAAVSAPGVHILGHPRGRMYGSRAGVFADWPRVFAEAAHSGVAVEIDGDPARQDLDFALAGEALEAGCLFALDSDAHATTEWSYAETAVAHARLAGIPAERVINCWPLERLLDWAHEKTAHGLAQRALHGR